MIRVWDGKSKRSLFRVEAGSDYKQLGAGSQGGGLGRVGCDDTLLHPLSNHRECCLARNLNSAKVCMSTTVMYKKKKIVQKYIPGFRVRVKEGLSCEKKTPNLALS